MGTAKVVSLSVRPLQASHLCFELDGIVGELTTKLGAPVAAWNFEAFYADLGASITTGADPSRLLYGPEEIRAHAYPFTLVALRAEPRKAALNKAVNARQNAYYAKYANAPAIISLMNQYYSPLNANSKPYRLLALSELSDLQATTLQAAYTSDTRTGVVRTTTSVLDSHTESKGTTNGTGQTDVEDFQEEEQGAFTIPQPPQGGQFQNLNLVDPVNVTFQEGTSGETSSSSGCATERQTIVNTDYGYRMPFAESFAQNLRAQISLIDEQFAQFIYGQNLPNLAQVFQNELNSIDSDVSRLQIAYLNTILLSPIPGIVTGIYKNPGDAVRAGEPVVRVENNEVVLLVANLIYRRPISIGSSVTVETTLFDLPGPPTTVTGSVVAVRGQREDDRWEVIVQCENLDASSNPIFPLGYHFDYDDTTVSIT